MITCPRCFAENRAGSAFCATCGSQTGPLGTAKLTTTIQTAPIGSGVLAQGQPLTIGGLLHGRYEIRSRIGGGGMGTVWKAWDNRLDNEVAVKSLDVLAPEDIQAFEQEARLLARLQHPQLPRVTDYFPDGACWYLVMDYIVGETLEAFALRCGTVPSEEVLRIGVELCKILSYLHKRPQPIVFRDLKPANILVCPDGSIRLVDFGIARTFKPGQAKDTRAYGTLAYAAPELLAGRQTTPASDLYSLGVVLHQLWTGDDPEDHLFHFRNVHPPEMNEVFSRLLERDPTRRISTAETAMSLLTPAPAVVQGSAAMPSLPATATPVPSPVRQQPAKGHILYLYSDKDQSMIDRFDVNMAFWKRIDGLTVYHKDKEMKYGAIIHSYWEDIIQESCMILLFLSSSFWADDALVDLVLQHIMPARSKTKVVIPIFLKPSVSTEEAEKLLGAKLAGLPTTGVPVSKWRDDDEAYAHVFSGLKTTYRKLMSPEK